MKLGDLTDVLALPAGERGPQLVSMVVDELRAEFVAAPDPDEPVAKDDDVVAAAALVGFADLLLDVRSSLARIADALEARVPLAGR